MQNGLAIAALVLALLGTGVGGYALLQAPADSSALEARLEIVEDDLSRVEAELGALREATRPPPSLLGLGPDGVGSETPDTGSTGVRAGRADREAGAADRPAAASEASREDEAIQEMVEAAVEKKAAQMRAMRRKKPPLDLFVEVLELDEAQRAEVVEGVVETQQEIKALLEMPAEDGTVFLDELVDILANGIANPGKDPERGARLFRRLVAEKVPGTDRTYAQQAEAMKDRLRARFKRTMNERQYATFEAWQMDPSEVQGVPGSPWKQLEGRVRDRAAALGHVFPDDPGPK